MTSLKLTRRAALTAGASLPLAAATLPLAATNVRADGHAADGTANNFELGSLKVSTLLAGTRAVTDDPQGIFGMNVSDETFAEVSAANFIPDDAVQFFFTPTVVDNGSEVVLFDTGLAAGGTLAALAAAGYGADDIDKVVITHMHGDHIGGLSGDDGTPTFKNASYVMPQAEYDHWKGADNDGFKAKVAPLAEKTTFIGDGASVASGITSVSATGHTPGHTLYMLESDGEQLLLTGDLANHHVWSVGFPDWEVRFDMDKAGAAASRKKILGMLAADRIPMIGYHMPFPGIGYIAAGGSNGASFQYVPATYQFQL